MRDLGFTEAALVVACLAIASTAWAQSDSREDLLSAVAHGEFSLDLRYRLEFVDDAAFEDVEAYASKLRTVVAYQTATFRRFDARVEFEDVSNLGLGKKHADGGAGSAGNGVTDRPVIADPSITEINQVYLRFTGPASVTLTGGRQEINLGEQRFVGAVGWRQNHQSFDAVRLDVAALGRARLTYGFVDRVYRIVADSKGMATHLGRLVVDVGRVGDVHAYVYLLDYRERADAGLSRVTYGLRWKGEITLSDPWTLGVHAEAAHQNDAGDNPARVDAGYYRLEARAGREQTSFGLGLEVLEGDQEDGRFLTPLATLHKFNGWADKFGVTPANGLTDIYAGASGRYRSLSGQATFHHFEATWGGPTHGQEIDLLVSLAAGREVTVASKAAFYFADRFSRDTTKLWLWVTYGFSS